MNQSQHLFQLQLVDSQFDKNEYRIKEIIKILADHASINDAELQVKRDKSNLHQANQVLRDLEEKSREINLKIETSEKSLYGGKIQNPKELQDIQNEIASLKRRFSSLEDDQLSTMLTIEKMESELNLSSGILNNANLTQEELHSNLIQEQMDIQKTNDKLKIERTAILASISPENLNTYQTIRLQKRGVGVVNIVEDTCSACGSTIRPAEKQAAKSPLQIAFCSSCGRILYAD